MINLTQSITTGLGIASNAGREVVRLTKNFGILTAMQARDLNAALTVVNLLASVVSVSHGTIGRLAAETSALIISTTAKWAEIISSALVPIIGAIVAAVIASVTAIFLAYGAPISLPNFFTRQSAQYPSLPSRIPRMAEGGIVGVPFKTGREINLVYPPGFNFQNRTDIDNFVDWLERQLTYIA